MSESKIPWKGRGWGVNHVDVIFQNTVKPV